LRLNQATFITKPTLIWLKTTPVLFHNSLETTTLFVTGSLRGKLITSHTIKPLETGLKINLLLLKVMPSEKQNLM
jgi:hypothetical protein